MGRYCVSCGYGVEVALTEKVRSAMRLFGLDVGRVRRGEQQHRCEIELKAGQVCYITGASGAGKSVLLEKLYEATAAEERMRLDEIEIETDKSLVDCIEGDLLSVLRVLSRVGLSDAFSVLNRPGQLSEGQRYRYRLAKAMASDKRVIFADEFCSNLDRITAAVIAHNVRRAADETGKIFVLASSHDDLLCDLRADVIVIKRLVGSDEVVYSNQRSNSR